MKKEKSKEKLSDFEFVDFKPMWKHMKNKLTCKQLDLFYDVVNIDGTMGRRIYPGCGREYNPRFYSHWFGHGRCHWNVVLPCFMLNDSELIGNFKIITNDKHSAIVDLEDKKIMCPTLNEEKFNRDFFSKDFEIIDLIEHLPSVVDPESFGKWAGMYL